MITKTYLTMKESADLLKVPLGTLKAWAVSGDFISPDVKVGTGSGTAVRFGWSEERVVRWGRNTLPLDRRRKD